MSKPVFFSTPAKLRDWFLNYAATKDELLVGYHKKGAGIASITWPESVDEALCYGWIDGIRRRVDEESYSIRFTPRRPGSNWSARNIGRVAVLIREERMQPAGMKAWRKRVDSKSSTYAYEQRNVQLVKAMEAKIRSNKAAWTFFQSLTPSTRKPSIWWVISAKKDETRQRRLSKLIEHCENQRVLPQFLRPSAPRKKK